MNSFNPGRVLACMFALCVLLVSACGITPPDARVPGSRALDAHEYTSRFAGKSVRMSGPSRAANDYLEMYFGKDGTLQAVASPEEYILEGTWVVNASLGTNIVMNIAMSGIENGQAYRGSPQYMTMFVYVLPDSTASVFSRGPSGPMIYRQPKPTPGFQARARFNKIKRTVANALGS